MKEIELKEKKVKRKEGRKTGRGGKVEIEKERERSLCIMKKVEDKEWEAVKEEELDG